MVPLGQTTIPKLELQATIFAAGLKKTIEDEMVFKFYKMSLWSDSKTVLSWTKNTKIKQDVDRKPNCWNKRTHRR